MSDQSVRASAPGKIVLLGEYAVLADAPALVAAVDRFASADVRAGSGAECRLIGANLNDAELRFAHDGSALDWQRTHPDLALMQALISALAQRGVVDRSTRPFVCSVDSSDFYRRGDKLGLGSSAATMTAAAVALHRWSGNPVPAANELFGLLVDVHRRHQNHTGSGLDIAAAIHGGIFSFTRPGGAGEPDIAGLEWPTGLHWCVVWTGRPASTGKYLTALRDYAESHPGAYRQQMERLGSVAQLGIEAFDEGGVENFLDSVRKYLYALTDFGRTTGLDIVSESHRGLAGLAELSGVVYKPCGAGGGDIGAAFSRKREPLTNFAEQVRRAGQTVLSLGLAGAAARDVGYP